MNFLKKNVLYKIFLCLGNAIHETERKCLLNISSYTSANSNITCLIIFNTNHKIEFINFSTNNDNASHIMSKLPQALMNIVKFLPFLVSMSRVFHIYVNMYFLHFK